MTSKEALLKGNDDGFVLARCEPVGIKSVYGWSSKYDDHYPSALLGIVPEPEFRLCISAINQTVEDFFPCPPGFICGYLCCVGTLGASIFCQDPYSLELEENLSKVFAHINRRELFVQKGIVWDIRRSTTAWNSWIEVTRLGYL